MNGLVCISTTDVVNYPEGGGHLWAYLNRVLGLRSLGFDVIWLDAVSPRTPENRLQEKAATFRSHLQAYGLGDRIALYYFSGQPLPASIAQEYLNFADATEADLLLNQRYDMPAELVRCFSRSALLDIDPGLLQIWMTEGKLNVAPHDLYFTIGETVGKPDAKFPDAGRKWHYSPPCVAIEWWPVCPSDPSSAFTTVSHWVTDEWMSDAAGAYPNDKRSGFLPFLDLPKRATQRLELALCALESDERASLEKRGWRICDAWRVASTPSSYQCYIQSSRGEFSCAKPSYFRLRTAWLSDRTLCYLASGKPAIVQHTGASRVLPDAAGLFRFRDFNEAVRCFEMVAQDYEHHSRSARRLAEEYFDARKVMSALMEKALSPRPFKATNNGANQEFSAKIATECISWRWNGNLGDDMIYAAQETMFAGMLDLQQYRDKPEAVLVGGGTLIPKFPEHPGLLELSSRLPTVIWGTGVGDPLFWGRDHIPTWLKIIENATYVGVRGPLSKARLEEWGVRGNRIEWIGDPALFFADGTIHPPVQGRLAVNFGTTYGKLYGFQETSLEKSLVRALQELARLGWNITFISVWQPDDEVVERISQQVSHSSVERWHDDYLRALESVEKFDLVICEKLHAGVVAACRAVPFVALNYRSKVMDFCLSIGWEEFCVEVRDLIPEQIVEKTNTLAAARSRYALQLCERVGGCKNRLIEAIPRALTALRGD